MTQALLRKALADIRSHRLQHAIIFFILMLATVTLTISIIVQQSANDPWDKTFERTNGAHVWLVAKNDVDLNIAAELDGVTETTGIIPATSKHPLIIDGDKRDTFLYAAGENPKVAIPLVVEGRWYDNDNPGELVLDFGVARNFDIKVGDDVEILTDRGPLSLKVVGLAVTSHWIPFQESFADLLPLLAYVPQPAFDSIVTNPENRANAMGIRLENSDESKAFVEKAHAALNGRLDSSIEWQWVREMSTIANQINVLFLGFFSILGLITVGFIIANIIGAQVVTQYREIGLLKSVGFTPRQVTTLFLVEHLLIGLAATIVGLIIGMAIAPNFTSPLADLLNTDAPSAYNPLTLLTILLVVEGAVFIFTVIPAWRGGRVDTVKAINAGYQRNLKRASRPAQLARHLGLSPVIVFGVKDTTSRPLRTGLTVIALILSISVGIIAVGSDATISYLSESPMYHQGTPADLIVRRDFVPEATARDDIEALSEMETYYTEHTTYGWTDNNLESPILIRALADDIEAFDFRVSTGRMFEAQNEAVAGYGLLNDIDAKVGDTVAITVGGKPLTVKVVGGYAEFFNTAHTLMVGLDTYQAQIDPTAQAENYGLALQSGTDREAIVRRLIATSDGQYDVMITSTEPNAQIALLGQITMALAVLLIVIASVNLFTTSWLGIRESFHDIAIQKSMGMTPRQVMLSVVTGVILITLIAFVIGIPVGLGIYRGFIDGVGQTTGGGPDFSKMDYPALSILLPIFILVAAISSFIPARKAAQLEVIDALRYE